MADQNRNRGRQNQQQGRNTQMQNRQNQQDLQNQQDQGDVYYSYSYGYGYYDPYTGDWIMNYYGPYTGVGPANYERSDDRICEDVSDQFWLNGQLDASDIEVDVKNGDVILNGTVPNRQMKRLAEDIAYSIPGVSDVQNHLTVKREQGQLSSQGSSQGLQNQQNKTQPEKQATGGR